MLVLLEEEDLVSWVEEVVYMPFLVVVRSHTIIIRERSRAPSSALDIGGVKTTPSLLHAVAYIMQPLSSSTLRMQFSTASREYTK